MFKRHSILILPLLIFGIFFAFSNKAEALTYTCKHDSGTGIGCGDDWYCTNAPGTGSAKCLTASAIFNRCTGLTPATIDIPNCAGTDTCGICSSCTNLSTGNGTLCGTYPSTSCVPAYSGSSPIANCSVYTADCSTTNTCSTCVSSSYENCDGGTRCQLKRTVSDAPVIPNCTAFNQCAAGQPCSSCASEYALCSATNSCVSNPSGDLCASLVNCTTGQCASCVNGASRCAATNTCVADKTCPSGQTFDPCATGSNYCTGTANSLKIGYDSLRPDNFLFNSTLSLPSLTIPPSGYVGLGTTTPSSILSVSGGNIFVNDSVITSLTPKAAITKDYLDSALSAYGSSNSLWGINGSNIFASSTSWLVGIGTTTPAAKLHVYGGGIYAGSGESHLFQGSYFDPVAGTQAAVKISQNAGSAVPSAPFSAGINGTAAANFNTYGGYFNNASTVSGTGLNYGIYAIGTNNYLSGSLGIGTTTPSAALDIFSKAKITSAGTIYNTDSTRYLDMTGVLTDSLKISGDIYSTAGELKTDGTGINYMLGSLGIGTTNPGEKLTVGGDIRVHSNLYIAGPSDSQRFIHLRYNSLAWPDYSSYMAQTGAANIAGTAGLIINTNIGNTSSNYGINLAIASSSKMFIQHTGNVGIGTTIPDAKLQVAGSFHVSGALNSVVLDKLTGTGNRIVMADASGSLYATSSSIATGLPVGTAGQTLRSDGTNWLANSVLYNNGTNVGIGTTIPSQKLSVIGTVNANHFYTGYNWTAKTGGINMGVDGIGGGIGFYDGVTANSASIFREATTSNFYVGVRSGGIANGITIDSVGNVGIGTTTPSASLDIFGKAKITSAGTIYNTNSTRYLDMTGVLTDSLKISGDIYSTAGELKTDGTGVNYMLGNLGIGTNSASVKLQISGGANQVINVGGGRIGGLAAPQSADEAVPLSYLTANYLATSSDSGVTSISLTATTYNGNLTYTGGYTGYDAGNKICNAYVTGSHFCRTDEILYLVQRNGASGFTSINGSNSWIADGPPGYTGVISADDCGGWTDGTNTKLGHFWIFASTGGGRGSLSSCDTMKKVACCK